MELMCSVYKCFREIIGNDIPDFSGIGLVAYEEKIFDHSRHCDLRPDIKSLQYSIVDSRIKQYLVNISGHNHTLHDGFHMMNSQGILTHVAQYFVPPVVIDLEPNLDHGVRLYSSMCGSVLPGVLFIAVISSDYTIYIFQNGQYVNLEEIMEGQESDVRQDDV